MSLGPSSDSVSLIPSWEWDRGWRLRLQEVVLLLWSSINARFSMCQQSIIVLYLCIPWAIWAGRCQSEIIVLMIFFTTYLFTHRCGSKLPELSIDCQLADTLRILGFFGCCDVLKESSNSNFQHIDTASMTSIESVYSRNGLPMGHSHYTPVTDYVLTSTILHSHTPLTPLFSYS